MEDIKMLSAVILITALYSSPFWAFYLAYKYYGLGAAICAGLTAAIFAFILTDILKSGH